MQIGQDIEHRNGTNRTGPDGAVSVVAAAAALELTVEAVRKRIQRGQLRGYRKGGRWFVWLETAQDNPASTAAPHTGRDGTGQQDRTRTTSRSRARSEPPEVAAYRELVGTLRAEVDLLTRELEVRTEELRRKDHIIAAFAQRLPELAQAPSPPSTSQANPAASMAAQRHRRWWWPW